MKTSKERLLLQFQAGDIKRYHTFPIIGEQTVGTHTYGVMQLVRYLTKDMCSTELLLATLDHDVPEAIVGDMPHTTKTESTELKEAMNIVEGRICRDYGMLYKLTTLEKVILKTADLMEMGLFGLRQIDLGNINGRGIVENIIKALSSMKLTNEGHAMFVQLKESYNGGE